MLIFQPIQKTLTTFPGLDNTIAQWGSKGLSNEKINSPYTTNHKLSPKIVWMNYSRIRLEFKGSWLKQDKVTFTPNNLVNLFIVYEVDRWSGDLNSGFTLKDCLFRPAKLTKNVDPDKYKYNGYIIGFDSCLVLINWKNIIIFGADMSSSVYIDNKNKETLILGKGSTLYL